jgi:hypothetical protein
MHFAQLTRPDDSLVAVNVEEILLLSPVPASGALMGPLTRGTRITFRNQSHQDVKELMDAVISIIDNTQHTQIGTLPKAIKSLPIRERAAAKPSPRKLKPRIS